MLPNSKECVCGEVIPKEWHYCWECKHKRDLVTIAELTEGTTRLKRHQRAVVRVAKGEPTQEYIKVLRVKALALALADQDPAETPAPQRSRELRPENHATDRLLAQERVLDSMKRSRQRFADHVPIALAEWNDRDD